MRCATGQRLLLPAVWSKSLDTNQPVTDCRNEKLCMIKLTQFVTCRLVAEWAQIVRCASATLCGAMRTKWNKEPHRLGKL